MNIYETLINEYSKQHKDLGYMLYLLNLNINISPNISNDYIKRYNDFEDTLFELYMRATSDDLKTLSEISKRIYGIDYIGYPEYSTYCKASLSFPEYDFSDEQMKFIFEGIKYIYDNYPHELP